jgi:HAD superfamily hydrolase (TIGR01484 family)
VSAMRRVAPAAEIPAETCAALDWLFTDIDDTLTTDGLLLGESFGALWRLHAAGVAVVPVTGRPAGWCDHIARMWPVAGVVGENGAFAFVYDRARRKMDRRWLIDEEERREGARRLQEVRRRVLAEVPGAGISADQAYRSVDLAVDYREDVGPLGPEAVRRICAIAGEEGATCKVSSIHVNCWYGSFSKVSGVEGFLDAGGHGRLDELEPRVLFVGDSPNDEPLFARLENSVGVANIAPFLGSLRTPPRYVTAAEGGLGFAELAGILLSRRG